MNRYKSRATSNEQRYKSKVHRNRYGQGWFLEPTRHSLSAKGISTGRKVNYQKIGEYVRIKDMLNIGKVVGLDNDTVNVKMNDGSIYKISKDELDYSRQKQKEFIKGGLSSGMPDSMFDKRQLEKGIKVELEHTPNRNIAKEITKDHLSENKLYYNYLEDMEKKMNKSKIHYTKKPKKTLAEIFFSKGQRAVKGRVKRGENGDVFGAVDDILTPLPEIDYARPQKVDYEHSKERLLQKRLWIAEKRRDITFKQKEKERRRIYMQTSEAKEKFKKALERYMNKKGIRERVRRWQKEYKSRPDVREHIREYDREYYPKIKDYRSIYQKKYRKRKRLLEE